jgi:hypothetical protein
MVALADLWIAILVAAALVFIVSSVIHMVIPIHKGDYGKLPGEDALRALMRSQGVQPGTYMFPCAGSMKEMGNPEHIAKMTEGPVGTLVVIPSGPMKMGKNLFHWFLYGILISVFTAYITGISTAAGAEYMDVFRRAGTVAILGYATAPIPDSVWKGVSWKITGKYVFDGILYGLATAGVFAWLWPAGTP